VTDRTKNPDKLDANAKRQERLDEALRANLKKRKQQVRKRSKSDKNKTDNSAAS